MIVKAVYKPDFGDKTTGETYETQIKRYPGDIFECEDALAKTRIKEGFVVKATKEEIEEYKKRQEPQASSTPVVENEDEQQKTQDANNQENASNENQDAGVQDKKEDSENGVSNEK